MRLWRVSIPALGLLLVGAPAVERAPKSPTEQDFLSRAQEHIAAREYWVSPAEDGLQAPNRCHGLRTWFEPTGVRVHDRAAGGSPRLLELRLAGVGRGDELSSVAPGEVVNNQLRCSQATSTWSSPRT